ncbi:MAG: hypothetical protein AB1306_09580 [Nitrospirota bacterium]
MRRVYSVIFLVSSSALIFEVSLTRLFSIYLSYHFAFMVISIAMLGIGLAGTILAFSSPEKLSESSITRNENRLALYALLAGVSIILNYIISNQIPFDPVKLSWERSQILYVALYCILLSIPFFFTGALIVTAFTLFSKMPERVYCSDLLGAGTGSLAVILLLNAAGPEYAIFSASTICFTGALIAGGRRMKIASLLFILFNLLLIILHPEFIDVRISEYKALPQALKHPEAGHLKTYYSSIARIDTLKSPAVRFAPGLSFKYLDPLPEQIGIAIDGGEITAVTESDDTGKLTFLEYLPSALAYEIGKKDNVLILEPKGGLQALMAEYYKAGNIFKIESNPMLVKVVRDDLREFSGGIFSRDTWSGYGRSKLRSLKFKDQAAQHYDIIDLSLHDTSVTGAFGFSEDYRLTVEAFKEYLDALDTNGILSVSMYLLPPPRNEFRLLTTVITSLEEIGQRDISKNLIAIRSWDSITILIKRAFFSEHEIEKLKLFSVSRRFDLLHYPGIKKEATNIYIRQPSDEYYNDFQSIIRPETRGSFIKSYLFDIAPVYDENPFFHYYLKLNNTKAIYNVMGRNILYFLDNGYLLPVILAIVSILSLIMILIPATLKIRLKKFRRLELFTLLYFAAIGLGFMFFEVTLIQKNILPLENPVYSAAVVLTTILISSGGGSILSSRYSKLSSPYTQLIICCLIFLYSLIHPLLLNFILPYSLLMKSAIISVLLAIPGFFMGIPFPMGIKLLGQKERGLIPWAWAINAFLSVLAPVLTIMLAVAVGFKIVLWAGVLAYLLAFISFRRLSKE